MRGLARVVLPVALACLSIASATASAGPAPLPRTTDGHPDLSGIWNTRSEGAVPSRLPYQPWAAARKAELFRERATADPLAKCYMPGVPRVMYLGHPFQIFQTPGLLAMTFEWSNMYRVVHTDGTTHPDGLDFWMGDARGRWEGDALVVDVRNHNDRTWFDGSGHFHSDALVVVERYRLTDANTIDYEATIEDTKVFTAPWTLHRALKRQTATDRLGDRECLAEFEEAHGLFEREPRTWYPEHGAPAAAPRFTEEMELAATKPKAPVPAPAANAAPIRRTAAGTPDLSGYYATAGGNSVLANYGLEPRTGGVMRGQGASKGFIIDPPGGRLPTEPWAHDLQQDRLRPERAYDDPAAHCLPIGSPRGMYLNEIQVLQTPGYVVFLFERMGYRIVALDGRRHAAERLRYWQGDAVGRWEGDTLVIDTTNFTGKTWLNEPAGVHGGEVLTWAEHLIERLTPIDAESVHYEATVLDPLAYTRPWTITFRMHQARAELLEVACKEDDQDLEHLKAIRDAARGGKQ